MAKPKRVRVLALLPSLVGAGGQRAVLDLCRGLDPDRFEPVVLVHERTGSFQSDVDGTLDFRFVLDRPYRRTDLPRLLMKTLRLAKNADVVLGGLEGRASFLGLLAAKLLRMPVVLWVHIDWRPFLKLVSWRQKLALRAYRFADHVVACSRGAAEGFSEMVAVESRRLEAIDNGIPVDRVRHNAAAPLPVEYAPLFAKPTVVTVGRLDEQKAQHVLIDAHARLRQRGLDHNLVVVGEGGRLGILEQQARDLGVQQSVHFIGFQTNPHVFMKHATLFALSSTFEGFGLVLAEALACATPVVSTDCRSGPSEVLEGGRYGVLVPPNNPAALADAIERLLLDPAARAEFIARAPQRAAELSDRHSLAKWEQLFTRLAHAR